MRLLHRGLLFPTLLAAVATLAAHPAQGATPVLEAMKQELQRSVDTLSKQPTPLYYLSYEITESVRVSLAASFGHFSGSSRGRQRLADIDLRVGSYDLDNTHTIRGRFGRFSQRLGRGGVEVPVDDVQALRSILWHQTDKKYKQAVERLAKVRADVKIKVEEEDQAGDFTAEKPEKLVEESIPLAMDQALWKEKLEKYTAPFSRSAHIYSANARVSANVETRWYVNSEGTEIRTSQPYYRLFISALTKADDGMELPRYESFFSFTPGGLPDDDSILKVVEEMVQDLEALRAAPVVDPYTGPAILSGRASAVFFHEILGHRVEGHRQKEEDDAQTFKKMVNRKVLPEIFSVVFDPTVKRIESMDLVGSYRFDNQGVKAQRVAVIENGVLKNFLMSRTPVEGFSRSNGHGRKQAGLSPVARQSNLFVEVSKPQSSQELEGLLVDLVKKAGKSFGLYFEDVQGGFTSTGRSRPNAFNVLPVMVYRIHADGRKELVRGVDLIGTPLTTFSKITAADNRLGAFNGICGAESGGVPVAGVSPAVLVSQIEVQKKMKSQERGPILPAPWDLP
ncbi:MAG: TldD/PmbA family protein [Acidobacteria bacterium]|nr:TldD/PmbA family protein [Acidobacteriota bacterium]